MTKQQIYDFLKSEGLDFEVTEHEAVFSMDELTDMPLPYPDRDAKNLFVRDDKRNNYYLITVRGDKRVDLKQFKKTYGTKTLSFASPDELMSFLKLTPGSVTPLGILSDEQSLVKVFLDKEFFEGDGRIGVHPCDNTATVWLNSQDLADMIRKHNNELFVVDIPVKQS